MKLTRIFSTTIVAVSLAAWTTGCAKTVRRDDPMADTHKDTEPGLFECEQTANGFKNKLANYHFPDRIVNLYEDRKVVVQLMKGKNETNFHFNMNALTDRVRRVLTDSDKIVFMVETGDLAEEKESETYQQESGDVRKEEQIKGGQGAGAHYGLRLRITNFAKSGDGEKENTFTFTIDLQDKERRTTVVTFQQDFRLTKG